MASQKKASSKVQASAESPKKARGRITVCLPLPIHDKVVKRAAVDKDNLSTWIRKLVERTLENAEHAA